MGSGDSSAKWEQIGVKEAQAKIEEGNTVVIDTRMPFDYAGGRIPSAVNLPGNSLRFRKDSVPAEKTLLVFSIDGNASEKVCDLAISLGYENVYNVEGGMEAWQEAGFDIETNSEGVFSAPRPDS